jgi:hypothetical protein
LNVERHILLDAQRLLNQMAVRGDLRLSPLDGGKNNRVYLVKVNNQKYLFKKYFSHPRDPRDRLGTEFSFSSFLWRSGIRQIPEPLTMAPDCRCALFEFVDGRTLQDDEISEPHVVKAMEFLRDINREKDSIAARKLSKASDACFSIADHLACVDKRIRGLEAIPVNSDITLMAQRFVEGTLAVYWKSARETILNRLKMAAISQYHPLDWDERYLSPSDFGFHNVLLDNRGQLRFIDFEYAGWDDLAKTICDFFCQVQVPVPLRYLSRVEHEISRFCPSAERIFDRVRLLLPAHRIKWCGIIMNEFLEIGAKRRTFAFETKKSENLAKKLAQASAYFKNRC